jgi:putative addiction module component (TIGR02574 family)
MQNAHWLPTVEKAELIERLFQSFDARHKTQMEAAWATEFESRLNAYKEGQIEASPLEEVMARINRK